MDANRFDLESMKFKGASFQMTQSRSLRRLLLEINDSTVIIVGSSVYVDFLTRSEYFESFNEVLYVLIDKEQYSELYKIDPIKKKSTLKELKLTITTFVF